MNNAFELMDLLKEVLEDIDFSIDDPAIISITIDKSTDKYTMCVQLVGNAFERFMSCVRARAEHIGEEVVEPTKAPMRCFPGNLRASWRGVPGLEFMAVIVEDK